MAHRITHPTRAGVHAVCGYSRTLGGFWVEVWSPNDGGHEVMHHGPATTGRQVPLREVLGVLVRFEFFGWADVHLAHQEIQMRLPNEIRDPDVRRAAEVLEVLKAEASE